MNTNGIRDDNDRERQELVSTSQSFYSRLAEVKFVKAMRKQNLIRVNGGFVRNRIYVSPEQFDFVWAYIVFRCPKGKHMNNNPRK